MSTGSQRSTALQTICLLRLTLRAPDIVKAILAGRQAEGMTLPGLMKGVAVEWGDQRQTTVGAAPDGPSAAFPAPTAG